MVLLPRTENFFRRLRFTSSLRLACIGLASFAPRKSLRTFAKNFLMRAHKSAGYWKDDDNIITNHYCFISWHIWSVFSVSLSAQKTNERRGI